MGAPPPGLLLLQPCPPTLMPDRFHILQHSLMVGPLLVRHKALHPLAVSQVGALIAELKAFLAGAGLDATGCIVRCDLLAFAAVA